MFDLHPAADQLARLIEGVPDHLLKAPTPCADLPVEGLVDHIGGFAMAFVAAAKKDLGELTSQAPASGSVDLEPGWRERIAADLRSLADAWDDPAAWDGMTQAGGFDMPGEIAGLVALNEVIAHGWDLARATGQPFEADEDHVAVCIATMGPQPGEERPVGTDVAFGRPVAVAADAAPVDRLAAVLGRDPSWTP